MTGRAVVVKGKKGRELVEVNVGGQVLHVVDPSVEEMFIEPKPHHGTTIALLVSRCIVPIQLDVFSIPERLLDKISEEAKNAEMMMPVEILDIKVEIAAFKNELAGLAATMAGKDRVAMFTAEAVRDAKNIARDYLVSVLELCESMEGFQKCYASSDAFYQSRTLGADTVTPDSNAIVVSIQNHILDMNKMSAGWGGYRIMALLKAIDQTAMLLDNPQIKALFGAADALAMLNKLNFRIQPDQMAFSQSLYQLAEMVKEIGETKQVDKKAIGQLITLCRSIKSYEGSNKG